MLNGRGSLADDIHHELPNPESIFAQLLYSLQKFTGDEPFEDETMSQQVSSLLISLFILSGMNHLPFYMQQAAFFTFNLICILVSYYISFLQR